MTYSMNQYVWFFIIYSFLGWWLEVTFQAVTIGEFINRGFLNGPVTPIYGFGMVILLYFLTPLVDQLIPLFIAAVFLTSTLEFITGFLLEKLFHDKWWDYSELPFNIKGYVALSFSLAWGLAAVFVLEIIHPLVVNLVSLVDNQIGQFLLVLILIYFIADFIVTLFGILEIKKRFSILNQMAQSLQLYSDKIGIQIYEKTDFIMEKANQLIDTEEERKNSKIAELKEMQQKLTKRKSFVHKRLERAYPNLKKRLKNFGKE